MKFITYLISATIIIESSIAFTKQEKLLYDEQVVRNFIKAYKELILFIEKIRITGKPNQIKKELDSILQEIEDEGIYEYEDDLTFTEYFDKNLKKVKFLLENINPQILLHLKEFLEKSFGIVPEVLHRLSDRLTSLETINLKEEIEFFFNRYDIIATTGELINEYINNVDLEYLDYLFNFKYNKLKFEANFIELFIKNRIRYFNNPIKKYSGINNKEPIFRVSEIIIPKKKILKTVFELGILWNNFISYEDYIKYEKKKKSLINYLGIALVYGIKPQGLGGVVYIDKLKIGTLWLKNENKFFFIVGLSKLDLINFITKLIR